MTLKYVHEHNQFPDLIRLIANNKGINPLLVEKDYYIMHCLYSLQQQGFRFELKGGTSLSKGYCFIHRFSEDIDICIHPDDSSIKTGKNHDKPQHNQARKAFYDHIAGKISMHGISDVVRDEAFDDIPKYRSGGIRLHYQSHFSHIAGVKQGILLELGFDQTRPSEPITISSWAYDEAVKHIECIDNRAIDVACYHAGYSLVEKLQTISTKYRKQQETGVFPTNFLRHYYDVYCLLDEENIQHFIGSEAYHIHKKERFPKADNMVIEENPAFLLSGENYTLYAQQFEVIKPLFYHQPPSFKDVMERIQHHIHRL